MIAPNLRWCLDGFEFTCWNGEVIWAAFVIDACDREVIAWTAVANAGVSGSDIRDMMLEVVKKWFGDIRAPLPLEWLSDHELPYTAADTHRFASQLDLIACVTPVASPESSRMSEAFVKSFKQDYVRVNQISDAKTALYLIDSWYEDYNALPTPTRGSSALASRVQKGSIAKPAGLSGEIRVTTTYVFLHYGV